MLTNIFKIKNLILLGAFLLNSTISHVIAQTSLANIKSESLDRMATQLTQNIKSIGFFAEDDFEYYTADTDYGALSCTKYISGVQKNRISCKKYESTTKDLVSYEEPELNKKVLNILKSKYKRHEQATDSL